MFANVAFAEFSIDDAQDAVLRMYDGAMITSVGEADYSDGTAWAISFHSMKISDGIVYFDTDTGAVVGKEVHYR